jgi:hypothetical protein
MIDTQKEAGLLSRQACVFGKWVRRKPCSIACLMMWLHLAVALAACAPYIPQLCLPISSNQLQLLPLCC